MNIKDIKDLIITMDKTSIEEVEIEKNDLKIKISKGRPEKYRLEKSEAAYLTDKYMETARVDRVGEGREDGPTMEEDRQDPIDDRTLVVKSPIVGTFYKAPSPDSPPFVNLGDMVEKGQILCIIEAMKIMNEIECEYEGEIVEILVENEDIVEFGQPLMLIRR